MAVEKIANRQLFFILFLARSTLKIAFLPVVTSADALQDAWISAILSFFGGALLVIAIGGWLSASPTKQWCTPEAAGQVAGQGVEPVTAGSIPVYVSAELRIYAEALTTLFITETPWSLASAPWVSPPPWPSTPVSSRLPRGGPFPIFLFTVFASLFIAVPQLQQHLDNLEPVLARGRGRCCGTATPIAVISSSWSWRSWSRS